MEAWEPRELTCSLVASSVRTEEGERGWLLGLVAHGVVGGPLGLPPPVAFPFLFIPLFFVEKKRREKNRDFGLFNSEIFY